MPFCNHKPVALQPIKSHQLNNIVERSRSILEIIEKSHHHKSPSLVEDPVALENWKNLFESEEEFERRLGLNQLTLTSFNPQEVNHISHDHALPPWADALNQAFCYQRDLKDRAWLDSLPFSHVYLVFLKPIMASLQPHLTERFSEEAILDLEEAIAQIFSEACTPTLYAEFETWRNARPQIEDEQNQAGEDAYESFINHLLSNGLEAFFQKYPVLGKLTGETMVRLTETYEQFMLCLRKDWGDLEEFFNKGRPLGSVTHLDPALSDPHDGGRRTICLSFQSGKKILYKPKSQEMMHAFSSLLSWCNQRMAEAQFKHPSVLCRQGYGWVSFIDHLPCNHETEVEQYYQQAGMLLFLVSLLGGRDFHHSNIIAHGKHPVLIDLEMLFCPVGPDECKTPAWAGSQLALNVLKTGMLPLPQFGSSGVPFEVGGLTGIGGGDRGYQSPAWSHVNTGEMARTYRLEKIKTRKNVVWLNGEKILALDYLEDLCAGIHKMRGFILKYRSDFLADAGPIAKFEKLSVRHIFRPTLFYKILQEYTLSPELLKSGITRSLEFEVLAKFILESSNGQKLGRVLDSELKALEYLDVPYFMSPVSATDLCDRTGVLAPDYFETSGYYAALERTKSLHEASGAEIETVAKWAMQQKMLSGKIPQGNFLEIATTIGDQIEDRALALPQGAAWIAPIYNDASNRFEFQPLDVDLYEGVGGIALFLAALAKHTNNTRYADLAMSAVKPIRNWLSEKPQMLQSMGISGVTGVAGLAYVMLRLGTYLQKPSLLDEAIQLTSLIEEEAINGQKRVDLIRGESGALLCFLAVYKATGERKLLKKALVCGESLLRKREMTATGLRSWRATNGNFLTGFSHGAAGIAYALLKLSEISSREEFAIAAIEAIQYENQIYDHKAGNWPDLRFHSPGKPPQFRYAWCHGAPGIGMSRLAAGWEANQPLFKGDVERAIKATLEHPPLKSEHLCCGSPGHIDFLLLAAEKLRRPELTRHAQNSFKTLLKNASERGYLNLLLKEPYFQPALFLGLSGIGHQALRLHDPKHTPSVLLLQ